MASSGDCKQLGRKGFKYENWSQTYSAEPSLYFEPEDEVQLRAILSQARTSKSEVKVVGNGHSPSDIACTNGYMISLKKINKVLDIDTQNCTVTVQAGVTIDHLNNYVLPQNGLAFQNLPSISNLSIGGTIATGTHGAGSKYGSFASCFLELWLMDYLGNIWHCSETDNKDLFSAAKCHLGLLGVIVSAKLQCEPAFNLLERYIPCTLDHMLENFHDLTVSSQHFRAMWFPHTGKAVMKCAERTQQPIAKSANWIRDTAIGYYLLELCLYISTFFSFLVPFISKAFYYLCCSGKRQMVERSDHVFNIECLFKQYVTEWSVPRKHLTKVIKRMKEWLDQNKNVKVHFPVEIRSVQKDGIMMSPSGEEDVTYIGIISYRPYGKSVPHEEWWNFFENLCKEFGGRPHWAKAHKEKATYLRNVYKDFDTFMNIRKKMDPTGMFVNNYWRKIFAEG